MAISTSTIKLIATATIAAAAVTAGSSSLYVYLLHRRLAQSTHHIYKSCSGKLLATTAEESDDKKDETKPTCTTIPDNVLTSDQYIVVYDRAWRILLNREDDLPSDQELAALPQTAAAWSYEQKLLTTYLRRNMSAFARYLPQARIIKMVIRKSKPDAVQTLDPAFIEKLDFVVGDVVCGMYSVVRREDAIVEFGIAQPEPSQNSEKSSEQQQGFEGRLVIGMRPVGDSLEVYSETIMWRDTVKKGVVMPLERKVPRVLHELASWWLLDSGVMYLRGLKK